MPIYNPKHIEHNITNGYIQMSLETGDQIPAYWAHPQLGGKYPAITLLHDWWGITGLVRRLANFFAEYGHYVIVPDLFDGQIAQTPKEAIALVEGLGEKNGLARVYAAIDVVEHHHQTNGTTGVVGLGMGGSFAFDVGVIRDDLEAIVAYGGFPQRNFGHFKKCKTPILALYGKHEPHITLPVIERLRKELAESPGTKQHSVKMVDGMAHEFFSDEFDDQQKLISQAALKEATDFLEKYLKPGTQRHQNKPL